jgi:chromosome segregation ATPase
MFAPKRILAVSMVILAAAAAGATFYALSQRAVLRAADKSATDLERAKQEWQEQERRHAEEMVKARMEVAEQEDQLHVLEQEWSAARADLGHVRKLIESALAKLAQPKVPQQLQREENELSAREQKFRADLLKARQKFFLAEEKMWQLAREQARQRDRLRARLDAAGEKRSGEPGAALQRRLQETEHGLEMLHRQLAEARHPAPPPQAPLPMFPVGNLPPKLPAR